MSHLNDPRYIETAKIIEEHDIYQDNDNGNGILFWSNTPETYELIYTDLENTNIDYSNNKLKGTFDTPKTSVAGDEPYVLNVRNGELWFNRLTPGKTLEANKAYLPNAVFAQGTGSTRVYFFFEDNVANGIEVHVATDIGSNNDETYYDLTGRRVSNPQTGVYIQNGKKMIVK